MRNPLDSEIVAEELKLPVKFEKWLNEQGVFTFGQLRPLFPDLSLDKTPGFTSVIQRVLRMRFSDSILCQHCGGPLLLYRDTKSCETPCPESGVISIPAKSLLHLAYPSRMGRTSREKPVKYLPNQASLFQGGDDDCA